jgi:hypothetical protein
VLPLISIVCPTWAALSFGALSFGALSFRAVGPLSPRAPARGGRWARSFRARKLDGMSKWWTFKL